MEWGEGEEGGGYTVDTYIPITLHQSLSKDYIKMDCYGRHFVFPLFAEEKDQNAEMAQKNAYFN